MLENPDGNENSVSLWSGVSDKDITVCPVIGRAYESMIEMPELVREIGWYRDINSSLTEKSVGDFYICI